MVQKMTTGEKEGNMLQSTLDAVKAIIKTDPSIPIEDREQIIQNAKQHGKAGATMPAVKDRLLSRNQVAEILGKTPRFIDLLHRQGVLQKFKIAGRKYSAGFKASEIQRFLDSKGGQE